MIWKYALPAIFAASFTLASLPAFAILDGVWERESIFPEDVDPAGRPAIHLTAFGDSILSGLDTDNFFGYVAGGGLVEQFGKTLSRVNYGSSVFVHNRSIAGSHSITIANSVADEADYTSEANYLILNGGGNDFLDLTQLPLNMLCLQSSADRVAAQTITNWKTATDNARALVNPAARQLYLTLHYGVFNFAKSHRCPDRKTSAFQVVLSAMARMNYFIAQASVANHAVLLDVFGYLNCDPSIRAQCDPRLFASPDAYLAQLIAYDNAGLLVSATDWKGDVQSPPINLLQGDETHPTSLAHQLLAHRLFDLFEL